jgi:hypothetical protein
MMRTIETTATVNEDGTLVVAVPPDVRPGRHRVVVVIEETNGRTATEERPPFDFPVHDSGPWPEGLSLRREDMYDDWGR